MWRRPFGRISGSPNACSATARHAAEREEWYPRVNAGIIVGNAITDAAGRAPSSADTKVLPDTAGVLRLNGYKFYSTGTLFADVIAVSALDADGRDVQVIIPADRPGVELFDDWDGFGQRTTASGGTRFTEVEVLPNEVVTVSDGTRLGHGTAFLQLYLATVAVGIAYGVFDDAVEYVRTKARPAAHSVADTADSRSVRAAGGRRDLSRRRVRRSHRVGRGRRHRRSRRPRPAA